MARPLKSSNPRARRDEILDQATRLFAERGYEGASMADLADAVGMRKASLFYHFASKEVLYSAVIDRLLRALSETMSRVMQTEGSFEERLDALTEGAAAVLGSQTFAARLMVREVMDWGPVIRGPLAESMMAVLGAFAEFIRAGQAAGVFVDGDPQHLMLSALSVQFLPFAVTGLAQRHTGQATDEEAFVTARKRAVRRDTRGILLARAQSAANLDVN